MLVSVVRTHLWLLSNANEYEMHKTGMRKKYVGIFIGGKVDLRKIVDLRKKFVTTLCIGLLHLPPTSTCVRSRPICTFSTSEAPVYL